MYDFSWNPYTIDPSLYVRQALAPLPETQPQMPEMMQEHKSYGPTHAALSNYFQQALLHQIAVPGLLAQMQQEPKVAQQIGGLLGGSYTPPAISPYQITWPGAAPAAAAPAAPSGE